MKIILNESYMNLGEAGDVIDVKSGYARNFLIPQAIATTANATNLRIFQDKSKKIEAKRLEQRTNAEKVKEALSGLTVEIESRASDEGKLFGSISAREISDKLVAQGAAVDRRQVILAKPIKMLGSYTTTVRLVGGITVEIPVHIKSDRPNLWEQQQRGESDSADGSVKQQNKRELSDDDEHIEFFSDGDGDDY